MRRKRWIILVVPLVVVLAGLVILAYCHHTRLYTATVLPQVGAQVVAPCAINDKGQIAGVCQGRFYLWERGKNWRELGRASGDIRDPGLIAINNAGQIAGTIEDPNGSSKAFLWDPNDGLTMLGTGMSVTRGLNNRGQVVGRRWDATGQPRIFVWSRTGPMRLMGGLDSSPYAMNDAGQVIGCRGSTEPFQCVLWEPADDNSTTETLAPPGAFRDINNHGYVLGQEFNFDKRQQYAFIWRQDRGVEWLFPLENQTARVAALNDANQVAVCEEMHSGWFERLTGRRLGPYKESFVWTRERGRVFLDGCVLARRGEYFGIRGMNNHGCVIGTVNWKTGDARRAVLLEPIPPR